ncbi:MAG: hypothetical protein NZT92_22195 [Abditibacteriales bacterium]|nr:hypothetical protein [Abditibacteriales bacterium]
MQQKDSGQAALIYGMIGVCVVSAVFGYWRAVQTRPERIREWVALHLNLEVEPRPQPAFFQLLKGYQRDERHTRPPGVEKRDPLLPSIASWGPSRRNGNP